MLRSKNNGWRNTTLRTAILGKLTGHRCRLVSPLSQCEFFHVLRSASGSSSTLQTSGRTNQGRQGSQVVPNELSERMLLTFEGFIACKANCDAIRRMPRFGFAVDRRRARGIADCA